MFARKNVMSETIFNLFEQNNNYKVLFMFFKHNIAIICQFRVTGFYANRGKLLKTQG